MMSITDKLFLLVPLISALCSIFLFLTILGSKKNKQIYAFMLLMIAFTAWTLGSLFLRLSMYPSEKFWYEVSVTGIFSVPFLIYNFVYYFTGKNAPFTRNFYLISWTVIAFLNIIDVFIKHPQITLADGSRVFEFSMTIWIAVPICYALITIASIAKMVINNVRNDGVPFYVYRPMAIGLAIMFLGTVSDVIPSLGSFPTDTLVCGINSICVYYTLYKKRLIPLSRIASNSSTYLLSAVFTTLLLVVSYPSIDSFYNDNFTAFANYKTLVYAIIFSVMTAIVYNIIRFLMNSLFVKNIESKEVALKSLSSEINKTLDMSEIMSLYTDYLKENSTASNAYMLIPAKEGAAFKAISAINSYSFSDITLSTNSPLITSISKHGRSVKFSDFKRNVDYKAMWESEKRLLAEIGADLIVPVMYDKELAGLTIMTQKSDGKPYGFNDITFMESTAAILSVALKNAALYSSLQREARTDSLTNLYNRRYFNQCIKKEFELAKDDVISYMLFNIDDFHLFNELYGNVEGDKILCEFARIINIIISNKGTICRYSGKEFAVFLPFCSPTTALQYSALIEERLKAYLSAYQMSSKMALTFSCGICGYPMSAATLEDLQNRSGLAVFSAKQNGKNQTIVYSGHINTTDEKIKAKRRLAENCSQMIFALTAAIDAKDHYTFNHSTSVATYASKLAEHIPLDGEHVEIIRQAGMLHDIGKIGIPESILSKTSRLTDEEYEIMKTHVEGSISMIRYLPSLDYVIPTAIGHHERWDGNGYPRRLKEKDIPIGARCLGIADAFDAMISKRPYRSPVTVDQALSEIKRGLGTQFDPDLGALFITLVQNGTIVPQLH
ncbi:MAG: diguanylate cyclase [Clostridiaceae bacterium]|nr:diguanylate cyclase [Clostridiaceae bacterium]